MDWLCTCAGTSGSAFRTGTIVSASQGCWGLLVLGGVPSVGRLLSVEPTPRMR